MEAVRILPPEEVIEDVRNILDRPVMRREEIGKRWWRNVSRSRSGLFMNGFSLAR
jgi:hypothetical protein